MDDDKKVVRLNGKDQEPYIEEDMEIEGQADADLADEEFLYFLECPGEYVNSPIKDQENFPLIVVVSGNFRYLGACMHREERFAVLGYPLIIAERLEAPQGSQSRIMLEMHKLLFGTALRRHFSVYYDAMFFLDAKHAKDKYLAQVYGNTISKILVEDSGLVPATSGDLLKLDSLPIKPGKC